MQLEEFTSSHAIYRFSTSLHICIVRITHACKCYPLRLYIQLTLNPRFECSHLSSMHEENNTSTVTESFLARWLVESYGLRGYGPWSDITMKQFIFLFCTYFQREKNLKFLSILKPSSRPQTMLEVGIFVLFLIKSLVQNQHGWFLTQGYPKGIQRVFVIGFDMQMCHSLTLRWQRSTFRLRPELTARYENDMVRCCRRAPVLCSHSRILVRESWERHCHAHVRCESINTRCQFLTVL